MAEEMVTIREFYDLNAAYLLRSRLEAENIPVFLQNENVVGMNGPNLMGGMGYSGALLQVPADKVDHAMAILQEVELSSNRSSEASGPPASAYRGALRVLGFLMGLGALMGYLIYMVQRNG